MNVSLSSFRLPNTESKPDKTGTGVEVGAGAGVEVGAGAGVEVGAGTGTTGITG